LWLIDGHPDPPTSPKLTVVRSYGKLPEQKFAGRARNDAYVSA
jgi:hypothetical protein